MSGSQHYVAGLLPSTLRCFPLAHHYLPFVLPLEPDSSTRPFASEVLISSSRKMDESSSTQQEKMDCSADLIPTFPPEIMEEILLRLPVKSLLKFRFVSTSWRSLISSPSFIKTHLEISTKDPELSFHRILFSFYSDLDPALSFRRILFGFDSNLLNLHSCSVRSLLYEPRTDEFPVSCPRKDVAKHVEVIGSCNGVLCILVDQEHLFLWNPSVRKYKELPLGGDQRVLQSPITYGFGFDETDEDYKVLRIIPGVGNNTVTTIYSRKSNSWRTIGKLDIGIPTLHCVFAQRKFHWCAGTGEIACLDLGTEKYGMIVQPNHRNGTLGVLGGCLSMTFNFETTLDRWVLNDYHLKSWTKFVSIRLPNGLESYGSLMSLCISRNGEILMVLGLQLMVYNAEQGSFRVPAVLM